MEGLSATPNHRRTIVTRTYPRNLSSALARRLGGPADAIPAIAALFVEIFLQMLRVRREPGGRRVFQHPTALKYDPGIQRT